MFSYLLIPRRRLNSLVSIGVARKRLIFSVNIFSSIGLPFCFSFLFTGVSIVAFQLRSRSGWQHCLILVSYSFEKSKERSIVSE